MSVLTLNMCPKTQQSHPSSVEGTSTVRSQQFYINDYKFHSRMLKCKPIYMEEDFPIHHVYIVG